MSNTRKTAPERVQALYRPEFLEEHHDHIGRGCNLPATGTLTNGSIHPPHTGCAWVVSAAYYRQSGCGCSNVGCNCWFGTPRRKAKARRQRYDGRSAARRWADQP